MVLLNLILNRCRRTAFLNSGRDASFVMAGGRQFHSFPTLCRKREEEIRPWVLNNNLFGRRSLRVTVILNVLYFRPRATKTKLLENAALLYDSSMTLFTVTAIHRPFQVSLYIPCLIIL